MGNLNLMRCVLYRHVNDCFQRWNFVKFWTLTVHYLPQWWLILNNDSCNACVTKRNITFCLFLKITYGWTVLFINIWQFNNCIFKLFVSNNLLFITKLLLSRTSQKQKFRIMKQMWNKVLLWNINVALLSANALLWCSRCKIYHYVAAHFRRAWAKVEPKTY